MSSIARLETGRLFLANDHVEYPALTAPHNPRQFYRTRPGLYVYDEFGHILRDAKPIESLKACTGKSYDLRKQSYDRRITAELPEGHEWDPSELYARLALMLEKQWGGKKGELLNNGSAILFYVPGFTWSVRWYADDGRWSVYVWERDEVEWSAGGRVFPRN